MNDTARKWTFGLLPLLLLGVMITLFVRFEPMGFMEDTSPPVQELTIDRITFPEQGTVKLHVVNGGPEPVTVAQVMVDEAYWEHSIDGPRTIDRLGERTITIPYGWVAGEPHEFTLVASTGITFSREVPVAAPTPEVNAKFLGAFALLGVYAGVVPVLIGLLWFPYLRDLSRRWLNFFLSLTVGLLLYLAVDGLVEAFEVAEMVPGAYQGVGLLALGVLGAVLALRAAGAVQESSDRGPSNLRLAYMIALGIGLHNLGEGLAIGAAYTAGELALGSFLVIGFAAHNTTEGLAIVAPVADDRPSLWHLAAMGAVAGLPTVAGTWIGGFSYSPVATTLFLALGVGAILQVAWEIGTSTLRSADQKVLVTPLNAAGLGLGLLVMYGTAIFMA